MRIIFSYPVCDKVRIRCPQFRQIRMMNQFNDDVLDCFHRFICLLIDQLKPRELFNATAISCKLLLIRGSGVISAWPRATFLTIKPRFSSCWRTIIWHRVANHVFLYSAALSIFYLFPKFSIIWHAFSSPNKNR